MWQVEEGRGEVMRGREVKKEMKVGRGRGVASKGRGEVMRAGEKV